MCYVMIIGKYVYEKDLKGNNLKITFRFTK